MTIKRIQITILFFVVTRLLQAQCSCTDCPVNTISNSTVTSTLNISGATNATLGSGGQQLLSVYLDYDTDAVDEVTMTLFAPNGSSVILMQNTGVSTNQAINFQICFNYCGGTAIPDPGFSSVFDSSEDWQSNTSYGGSYFPAGSNPGNGNGCFETLTGSVNGNWVLQIQDFIGLDDGIINDWFLVFADNAGTGCTADVGCALGEVCLADGGELSNTSIDACEGDLTLAFALNPQYPNGSPPAAATYGYIGVISDAITGEILEYSTSPDLTTYSVGTYQVCGLSYELTDFSLIPTPDGVYSISDLTSDINNSVFCADLSATCTAVNIIGLPNPILIGPTLVCENELVQYVIANPQVGTIYNFILTNGTATTFTSITTSVELALLSGNAQLCLEATNLCGTTTVCIDIVVSPSIASIILDSPPTGCPLALDTYEFLPVPQTGQFYAATVTGGSIQSVNGNSISVVWNSPPNGLEEICVSLLGGQCPSDQFCFPIQIADVDIPDQLLLDNILCLGESDISSVIPSSDVINYSWTLTNLMELSGNGSPLINYTTIGPGLATVCLTMETVCGVEDPLCEDIIILDILEPPLFLAIEPCNLSFTLTTIVPPQSIIQWSLVSGPGISNILSPNSPFTSVTVSTPGTYIFAMEQNLNDCIGVNSIEVVVPDELSINFIDFDCNINQEYMVTLEIIGGQAPYLVNNLPISGSTYTSTEIPSGDPYVFLINDSQGCEIPVITGNYECLCNTDSGTMTASLLEACADPDEEVQAETPTDSVLAQGDIGLFYLHDNAGNLLGNIIEINSSGNFSFQAPMIAGVTYYISYVVGQAQNGVIDLANPCTSISVGQPVVFYPKPVVTFDIPDPICDLAFSIIFDDTSTFETVSWNFQDGPANLDIDTFADTVTFLASQSGKYTYELTVSSNFCDTSQIVEFTVLEVPKITSIQQNCSPDPAFYTLNFQVIGGVGPFSSTLDGSFDNGNFTSILLDTGQVYNVVISDINGCSANIEVNPINCSCDIDLGTIVADTISLCQSDLLDPAQISLQNFMYDSTQYMAMYYTYATNTSSVEDYIEFSTGDAIAQDPTYITGNVYYLRLIISSVLADPADGLDLDDPCVTVSTAVPFVWLADYQFNFDIHPTVCTTENMFTFTQNFSGPYPYTIGFTTVDGNDVFFTIEEEVNEITLPIFEGGTDWELSFFDGNCGFSFSGNLTITGESPQEYTISSVDTLCNNEIFGSILVLEDLVTPAIEGTWFLDGMEQTASEINFDGYTEGTYQLIFVSNQGNSACPISTDTIEIQVKECNCPIVITQNLLFCTSEGIIDPAVSNSSLLEGEFSVNNVNGLASPPVLLDQDNLDISSADGGEYEIIYTLTDEWPAGCTTSFASILTINQQFSSGIDTGQVIICEGDIETFNLFDLLTDYDEGGNWNFEGSSISEVIDLESLSIGENIFNYSITGQPPCVSVSTSVTIELNPKPQLEITAEDVLCYGANDGIVMIEIVNSSFGPYVCELNGEEQVEKQINDLPPGYYTVRVTDANQCVTEIDSVEIGEPQVLEIELGDDRQVSYNELVTINALLNILEADVSAINWEDLNGIIDENGLSIIKNAIENNVITLTITDANGCVAVDSVKIRIIQNDIMLANIILPNSSFPENQRFGMPAIARVESVVNFRIYDRWGNEVFQVSDIEPGANEGYWYGTYQGQAASQGVYSYIMTYRLFTGEEVFLTGSITLIR